VRPCAPCVPPQHHDHDQDAHNAPRVARNARSPRQPQPSQREGQLDDEADYQTAYQSARTGAVNGGRGGPIASLRAGPQHRPTVDGMEEVRGSSPISSTPNFPWSGAKRIGVISALCLLLTGCRVRAKFGGRLGRWRRAMSASLGRGDSWRAGQSGRCGQSRVRW
jgi:hypothetical protein